MTLHKLWLAALGASGTLVLTSMAHANCYAVFKGDARIYHAMRAPVDTSLPYSESVPARFGPGATMVVTSGAFDCPSENEILIPASAPSGTGPFSKADEIAARDRALTRLAERHSVVGDGNDGDGSYGGGQPGQGPIMTGPRGGKYYINGNGNKTYVGSSGSRSGGGKR
ncbi:MAG: hypothetical protein EKK53_27840 [Burkholderiales bacterium]|nr:MAG: hypothetical protein EKK53_27840 [Burkholderiales bacterium]